MNDYIETKKTYYDLMMKVKNEKDPSKQSELISSLLEINSNLAKLVREKIQDNYEPYDLLPELKKIQKEYLQIQESKDKKITLEMILNEKENQMNSKKFQFNILLFFIILSIIIILYIIIQRGVQKIVLLTSPI
jgi:hypothetical protein